MMIQTERLILRQLTPADAPFILQLLNEPSWLQFIGDRGVRTLAEAEQYIINGPIAMYVEYGFGLYVVEQKENPQPMGLCGLIKRPLLEDVDIGFAFLPAFWGQGFAAEAAGGVLQYGREVHQLPRVVAITSLDNDRSARVLEKIGLRFERLIAFSAGEEVRLFGVDF
jgi:RimJ/RimL family protein N-acetyltransferase